MINLIAPEMKRQIRAARINVVLLNYCVILSLTAVAVVGIFGAGTWVTMQERAEAETRKAQAEQDASQFAKTKQEAESFANDLKQAKTILASEVSFYDLITRIAAIVPEGVILSNFSLGTNVLATPITINAKARSYEDAVKLKNSLADSPIFDVVNLSNASQEQTNAAQNPVGARYPVSVTLSATFSKDFAKSGAKQ